MLLRLRVMDLNNELPDGEAPGQTHAAEAVLDV